MKLVIVLGMAFALTAFGQQANPPAQPPDGQAAPQRQRDGQPQPQEPPAEPAAEPTPQTSPQATPAQQPGQAPPDDAQAPADGAPAPQQPAPQAADPAQQPPADPAQQQAADPPQQPSADPPQQQQVPQQSSGGAISFRLRNAGLLEVIDTLARQLRINYVLDPAVKEGSVTITTYGSLQQSDLFPLFYTILRINGVVAVKVGNLYRIVPAEGVTQQPITPQVDAKDALPDDEQMILNVIRLRYTVATELAKVLEPFLGAGAKYSVVEQANMILLLDNSRNMRRTMDLIAMFDTEELASQRMRLFKVTNSLPSSLTTELDTIFSALALSADQSAIKFVPLDRISSILVVSGSETVFGQVQGWIEKLDQPVTVGGVQNFIYKVQYGSAQALAMTMLQLYGFGYGGGYGGGYGMGGYGGFGGYGGYGGEYGGFGGGGYGGGFGGGGFGGGGFGGRGGGFGQGGLGGGFGGGMGGGYGGFGGGGIIRLPGAPPVVAQQGIAPAAAAPGTANQTGQLLGSQTVTATQEQAVGGIRIVPDMINNLIVVQATKQEWEVIRKTLHELDFPPRQVLIDAKIYEVQLTGAFQSGVRAALVERGQGLGFRTFTGGYDSSGALTLSVGQLVGMNRELEILLNASASNGRSKVISAPSIIATDNIAATLTVGQSVPTLSSQALAGGTQSAGSSLFTNTISNVQTGVSLSILARVNASGIITMQIDQEVSSPVPPASGGIQSPSIDRRNVSTQITVNDGDPIAIAGIIQETQIYGASRVPVLGSIPVVGAFFGSTSISNAKSELVIIMRPRVIYDENEIVTASEELTDRLKLVRRLIRD